MILGWVLRGKCPSLMMLCPTGFGLCGDSTLRTSVHHQIQIEYWDPTVNVCVMDKAWDGAEILECHYKDCVRKYKAVRYLYTIRQRQCTPINIQIEVLICSWYRGGAELRLLLGYLTDTVWLSMFCYCILSGDIQMEIQVPCHIPVLWVSSWDQWKAEWFRDCFPGLGVQSCVEECGL